MRRDEAISAPNESARRVFLAWEKLRLLYNFVLTVRTLLLGASRLGDRRFWVTLLAGAAVANLCFCTGPCFEGYLNLLGLRRRETRGLLFALGLMLAMLLTAALVIVSDPEFD
jgi:hypothetical protein